MARRIAILGDSSSSGIGVGTACYPAKLYARLGGTHAVEMVNYAVPGCTSADASRLFHEVVARQPWDDLIVYLGNNEAASAIRKGHWSRLRRAISRLAPAPPRRPFKPVLSPPRFRFSYELEHLEVATTPQEFGDNLRSIARRATRAGVNVVLVNPIANRRFPCGVGAPNSAYFCYLDDLDRLGNVPLHEPIDAPSNALAAGVRQFVAGAWGDAVQAWRPLAATAGLAGFIARHNLACAAARLGEADAASRLRGLLGEIEIYDSTILYNLAALHRLHGDAAEAARLLDQAFECDHWVYRVRAPYRAAIAGLAGLPKLQVLDLKPILAETDFVDYCHPTDAGHDKIASALADVIRPAAAAGSSSYVLELATPNYLGEPGTRLTDYYCMDWPLDPARIQRLLDAEGPASAGASDDSQLAACLDNFRRSNARHPIFTDTIDLRDRWRPLSHEMLSFPEFFLWRLLHNYFQAFERERLAERLRAGRRLERVRLSAADYARLILRANAAPLDTALDLTPAYYGAIVRRAAEQLIDPERICRVMIGERIRTTTMWYTRESFRYGTQSRLSMLYARWDIDMVVEALIVAVVIAHQLGRSNDLGILDGALSALIDLIEVHERHVGLYHRQEPSFSLAAYDAALREVRVPLAGAHEALLTIERSDSVTA